MQERIQRSFLIRAGIVGMMLVGLMVMTLTGCGNKPASSATGTSGSAQAAADSGDKLLVYNWTYYIPDEVIKAFETEFKTSVVYDVYASNEEMFAKLKAGGTGYDIAFPSGDYVSIMAKEGMLKEIDKSKIPNFANIDPSILAKITFDQGNKWSVPYMIGAAGIIVNTAKVPNFDQSWSIFDRKDLKNRMTMLDDMREVMGAALKFLGYSVNTTDPKQLEEAKKVVLRWKDNLQRFDAESFGKAFAAGEFWVVQGYQENVYLELDPSQYKDTKFFIPKEGSPMYMDNMVILKDAKHVDLAYKFIDYIHRPEVYAQIADFLGLQGVNVPARAKMTTTPRYTIDDLKNSEFKDDLGPALDQYNQIWQDIRAGQ